MLNIFQFPLKSVKSVSLVDRRGYLTVSLELEGEAGLVVRKPEGLRDWYNTVQKMVKDSKARVMLSTEQFWNKGKAGSGGEVVEGEEWLVGRRGPAYHYSDRPVSVASVDRRHRHRQRHRQYQCKSHSSGPGLETECNHLINFRRPGLPRHELHPDQAVPQEQAEK